jgi:hypothetical protein
MDPQFLMSINNKKIFEFYNKHKTLDFENVNLYIIELFEKINTNPSLDNIMAGQILQNMSDIDKKINEFKDTISVDLQKILSTNNNEKIAPMIKEYMQSFHDKTKIMFNETIPTHNDVLTKTIALSEHRLKENLSEIKTLSNLNQDKQLKLSVDVTSLLNKMENTPGKGKISENSLGSILNVIFPSAEINNVANTKESADYILIREGLHDIRFENKNFGKNVPTKEVTKFKRDMEVNNSSGIMLTQNFGISSKDNFEIEIINNNVYVYLHNVQYEADKIKTAVSIIDHMKKEMVHKEVAKEISMDKTIFAKINADFIKLIEQRDSIIIAIKKSNEKLISEVREIEFPSLSDFIAINSGCTESKKFICQFCGKIPKKNNFRGLETHQRTCKEKKLHEQKAKKEESSDEEEED